MYALIIGSIASLLSSIDAAKATFWQRVEGVNHYLRSRDVPQELRDQARDYFDYVWDRYRAFDTKALIRDVPHPIRPQVLVHLTADLLEQVPLFRHTEGPLRDALLRALEL
jgi:cyclic nucleotide gated channel